MNLCSKSFIHMKQIYDFWFVSGIKGVFVNLEDEVVLVRSVLPSCQVQGLLESTGKLVVFRGYGGASHQGAVT